MYVERASNKASILLLREGRRHFASIGREPGVLINTHWNYLYYAGGLAGRVYGHVNGSGLTKHAFT